MSTHPSSIREFVIGYCIPEIFPHATVKEPLYPPMLLPIVYVVVLLIIARGYRPDYRAIHLSNLPRILTTKTQTLPPGHPSEKQRP